MDECSDRLGDCAMKFVVYKTRRRQPWRWRLLAGNNKIIACSGESYFNRVDALYAVQLVMEQAPEANIVEKGSPPSPGKRRSLADGTA